MEKFKQTVVLFDLDGTVIDSLTGIMNAITYAFKKTGRKPVTVEEFLPYVGPPIIGTMSGVYGMSEEEAEYTMSFYHEYYRNKGWRECSLYEGIPLLLKSLKEKGKIIALATNKPSHYAADILKDKKIDMYFDYIGGADAEKGITNKTLVIEDCLKQLKVTDKKKVIMIGDRKFDVEGATGAGVDTIGVTYGYGNREELIKAGAVTAVNTTEEVNELF